MFVCKSNVSRTGLRNLFAATAQAVATELGMAVFPPNAPPIRFVYKISTSVTLSVNMTKIMFYYSMISYCNVYLVFVHI